MILQKFMTKNKMENNIELLDSYVYIYLDPRKSGKWEYKNFVFDYQPFYIGKGIFNRINFHLKEENLQDDSFKSNVLLKIRDAGLEPISFKLFENISDSKAMEIEIDLISYFGRRGLDENGILTNRTQGGDGMRGIIPSQETLDKRRAKMLGIKSPNSRSYYVDQFDLEGNFIKRWDYLRAVNEDPRFDDIGVYYAISKPNRTHAGYIWRKGPPRPCGPSRTKLSLPKQPVYQYSLDGDFIQKFDSNAIARRVMGTSSISSATTGRCNQSMGFQWFNDYRGEKVPPVKAFDFSLRVLKTSKPIQLFSEDNELIKEYPSIKHAAEDNNIVPAKIGRDLKRGRRIEGGYWKLIPNKESNR